MRTSQLGQFDAVLTIFNAICHLTVADFEQAVHNIAANLKPNGLYILIFLTSIACQHEQIGDNLPAIITAYQTLQVYSASQLTELLYRCGFQVIQQTAIDGTPLKP